MRIRAHKQFRQDFKILSKKYPSLESDMDELAAALRENPTLGQPLGKNRYKVRLKIKSKGKGKSGGGRVITYLRLSEDELCLLTLYDKSEMENVNDAFLDDLVARIDE